MNILILAFASLLLLSCEKKVVEQENPSNPPVQDYSLRCEENFVSDWCSPNLDSSEVVEVCSGTLLVDDTIFSALALKIGDESKCFLATDVSQPVSYPGCANAVNQEYVSDLNRSNPFAAVYCLQANRKVYFDGENHEGIHFRAHYIE